MKKIIKNSFERMQKGAVVILCFLFFTTSNCGKSKSEEYDIYENHDISACGMDDPLRNMDWLAEFTAENSKPTHDNVYYYWNIRIELYANIDTHEKYLVISFFPINLQCTETYCEEPPDPYYSKHVYTCLGERLFIINIEDAIDINSYEWDEFFYSGKNEPQGIIWYRNRIN